MVFYLILIFILRSATQGETFSITSHFLDGDLKFTWPQVSSYQDVSITCDGVRQAFTRVYDNQYRVSDVLKYNVVSILVRATISYNYHERRAAYRPNIRVISENETVRLTLPVPSVPPNVDYKVFKLNINSEATIIPDVRNPNSLKYPSISIPGKITFEITNVTSDDAGYYSVGYNALNSRTQLGIILVVRAKPSIPTIAGKTKVPIGEKTALTCYSSSQSMPQYYTKFPAIIYTWFINDSKVVGGNGTKFEIRVEKKSAFDKITCKATELLESTSDDFYLEPLYGPEFVDIYPKLSHTVSMHDNTSFGPVNCSAECNPPCIYHWEAIDPRGRVKDVVTTGRTLHPQTVRRGDIETYRCVTKGLYRNTEGKKTVSRDIKLNIQYLTQPTLLSTLNGNVVTGETILAKEGDAVTMNCSARGNPEPEVFIRTGENKRIGLLGPSSLSWYYHSFASGLRCTNTDSYTCIGINEEFQNTYTTVKMEVACSPRLDVKVQFNKLYLSTVRETIHVNVPIISFPEPEDAYWAGPIRHDQIQTNVALRNRRYQFWISSQIPIPAAKYYGNYTLVVEGLDIVTVRIQAGDRVLSSGHTSRWSQTNNDQVHIGLGGAVLLSCFVSLICCKRRNMKHHQHRYGRSRTGGAAINDSMSEAETYLYHGQEYIRTTPRSSTSTKEGVYEEVHTYIEVEDGPKEMENGPREVGDGPSDLY
ncbi:uncharacterized protein LOC125662560 [Ostrea edulis]|uniref:uncharacterized protein LOC125662560 n=1 Tax=Ostrea edulis TaxID=37623 RepID=UPI0024AFDC09|nr:uncharacterized protein LOC125662560 [Ostrea edulis]